MAVFGLGRDGEKGGRERRAHRERVSCRMVHGKKKGNGYQYRSANSAPPLSIQCFVLDDCVSAEKACAYVVVLPFLCNCSRAV